ncbi:hypothetical protein LshimejAT787_0803090 [Lyophyllum shimeji]|uniref:Uncharacterized protein n=1 Tax=Lyophyllum shimeji TaxID=47721 RepID=A0A9P3PR08_LYOSH|nr:hypothetical protein LshimejAT787_0803090 [Lyophyllum shimeji]
MPLQTGVGRPFLTRCVPTTRGFRSSDFAIERDALRNHEKSRCRQAHHTARYTTKLASVNFQALGESGKLRSAKCDAERYGGKVTVPGPRPPEHEECYTKSLPKSNALNELPFRPPAPSTTAEPPSLPSSTSTSPAVSRASSAAPTFKPKTKSSRKSKSKESTPRPSPPEIPLPDPSGPPPANFLRNQAALLGTAGLVSGVSPAHLSTHRPTRGNSPNNPIVVDDEEGSPPLGRSRSRQPYMKPVDPSLLPAPSMQDVVAMLIGQKDIFPVLESLLRLIAAGPGYQAPQLQSSFKRPLATQPPAESGPPTKKRKLNRVPAGAADWDVPFPFAPGEGPVSYRTTWERERGKQLISQLATLIKGAVRKAATRLYYQNEEAKRSTSESQQADYAQKPKSMRISSQSPVTEPKVHGHYRPSTATYGLQGEAALVAKAQAQEVLTDASNVNTKSSTSTSPSRYSSVQPSAAHTPVPQPQPPTPFDHLIYSLLAATPTQNVATDRSAATASTASNPVANVMGGDDNNASMQPDASTGVNTLDQGLFDNWMNVLQAFPMPSGGFSQSQNPSGHLAQSTTSTSTSTNDNFNFFNLDQTNTNSNYIRPTSYDFESLLAAANATTAPSASSSSRSSHPQAQPAPSTSQDSAGTMLPSSHPGFAIDPSLLAISIPQSQPSQPRVASTGIRDAATSLAATPTAPSLAASPIPSQSSFGEAEPTSPKSAIWDLSIPEVLISSNGDGSVADKHLIAGQGHGPTGLAGQGGAADYVDALFGNQSRDQGKNGDMARLDKGKGRDTVDSIAKPQPLLPSAARTEAINPPAASILPTPATTPTPSLAPSAPKAKLHNKVDIMRRAAERKKQLMEEISSVRTQLWETTIEQGVLAHMSKLCSNTTST